MGNFTILMGKIINLIKNTAMVQNLLKINCIYIKMFYYGTSYSLIEQLQLHSRKRDVGCKIETGHGCIAATFYPFFLDFLYLSLRCQKIILPECISFIYSHSLSQYLLPKSFLNNFPTRVMRLTENRRFLPVSRAPSTVTQNNTGAPIGR